MVRKVFLLVLLLSSVSLIAGSAAALVVEGGTLQVFYQEVQITLPPGSIFPCTHSAGYWKTHAESWPIERLALAGREFTRPDLLVILGAPPEGDATLILANQLIAVRLNLAAGAEPTAVLRLADKADQWLYIYPLGSRPEGEARNTGLLLATFLEAYNLGQTGPGLCPDETAPRQVVPPTATPQPPSKIKPVLTYTRVPYQPSKPSATPTRAVLQAPTATPLVLQPTLAVVTALVPATATPALKVSLPIPGSHCVLDAADWLAQPSAWPVTAVSLGDLSLSQSRALELLRADSTRDASLRLARALIAAKLNAWNGADWRVVEEEIQQADLWFVDHNPGSQPSTAVARLLDPLSQSLDAFNQGLLGPAACPPPSATPLLPSPTATPVPSASPAASLTPTPTPAPTLAPTASPTSAVPISPPPSATATPSPPPVEEVKPSATPTQPAPEASPTPPPELEPSATSTVTQVSATEPPASTPTATAAATFPPPSPTSPAPTATPPPPEPAATATPAPPSALPPPSPTAPAPSATSPPLPPEASPTSASS